MGTKNNPGEFDCYKNLHPDEPYFLIRANDIFGPVVVRMWAQLYKAFKPIAKTRAGRARQRRKVKEANTLANRMEAWRQENDR